MNPLIPDLYGPLHRAARLAICDFLALVCAAEPDEPAARGRVEAAWGRVDALLAAQAAAEAASLFPLLRIAAPALADRLKAQHAALEACARRVRLGLSALGGEGEARGASDREACSAISALLSAFARHCAEEENRAMAALAGHFAPVTLFAARRALLASLPEGSRLCDAPVIAGTLPGASDAVIAGFLAEAARVVETATLGDNSSVQAIRKAA